MALSSCCWAANDPRRRRYFLLGSSNGNREFVRPVVFELRRSLHAKCVPPVTISCVAQIFTELVCNNCRHVFPFLKKVNAQRRVWLMFVQSPAGNLLAVGPLEPAHVVELGTGA